MTAPFPSPEAEQALKLRLLESKSYADIGRALGLTKWQARDLVKAASAFLDGYGAGFRAARELRP